MQNIPGTSRLKVSADGHGVVSHAGIGMVREVAEGSGLTSALTAALIDSYRGIPIHEPGRVITDLAAAVVDGESSIGGIETLSHREEVFGPVASTPTAWRVLDRVTEQRLPLMRAARAAAREHAWAAGAGPDVTGEDAGPLVLDVDATITIAHSEKENAAATWKRTFGFHPLLVFLDRGEIAGGEALAGILRPGNAGSNTAEDHISVFDQAIEALPAHVRPGTDTSPGVLVRSDSAGATKAFAAHCHREKVEFSFGFAVDHRIKTIIEDQTIPEDHWVPAIEAGDDIRKGAWVAEATGLINLDAWPAGTRLILRKERPHPGAQLNFTDADGLRITAFITNTKERTIDHEVQGLELRHRQHARVEDRIRQAKVTGLGKMPSRHYAENQAWLQVVMIAADLIAWTKLIGFRDDPELARCEINTFRHRVLHVAARVTRNARRLHLRIDATWRWATAIAAAYHRIRAAFVPT